MQDRMQKENAGAFGLLSSDLIHYTTDSYLNKKEAVALGSTCRFFATNQNLLKLKKSKHKKVFTYSGCSFILNGHGHLYGIGVLPRYLIADKTVLCTPITLPNQIPIREIIHYTIMSSDQSNTVILATDGTVYNINNIDFSRYFPRFLNCGYQANSKLTLISVPENKRIKQVAAGFAHMIALAEDGTVYGHGSNEHGHLGLNDQINRCEFNLIRVPENHPIKEVATSNRHTLMLANNGTVYGCGENNRGQLGLVCRENQLTPTLLPIPDDKPIKYIIAENESTILIAEDGSVYCCGCNHNHESILTPQQLHVPDNKPIKQATAFNNSLVLLASDGTIYGCGFNSCNSLGLNPNIRPSSPQVIPIPENKCIKQVSLGLHHLLVVTEDDLIFGCGALYGQLVLSNTLTESLVPIDFELVLQEQINNEEQQRLSKEPRLKL